MANEVIAAVATPPGRGGIGVVRVSGPDLRPMLQALTNVEVRPRYVTLVDFRDASGEAIDQGVLLFFAGPQSYTGEDVIELQGHGGPVVQNLLLQRCLELGARIAEPGEFTKRAFLNDKLDLTQAESVADLIDAATSQAARCAVRSLHGEFSKHIDILVTAVTELRVWVEATLDFPEEDVELLERGNVRARLTDIGRELQDITTASQQGRLLREGIHVVLAGHPNVGKSSLLNALAGVERAIVTDIPGTTRDAIRESVNLDGVPMHIVDTAGLREPRDVVERIGIAKTWEAVRGADLILWVSDVSRPETSQEDPEEESQLPADIPRIHVINKLDLPASEPYERVIGGTRQVGVSAKSGAGLELLKAGILATIGWSPSSEGLFMARERHLEALNLAATHLKVAGDTTQLELLAEELKLAQQALATITGEFTADDLLGRIFSSFCIGK